MSDFLDPETWRQMGLLDASMIIAFGVVALGGFLRGFTGFGGALVIVPVLSLIFSPREAVPMHTIMELPGVLQLLPVAVRDAHRPTVVPMIATLVAALPIGVYLLVSVDQDIMRIVISVAVLLMVAMLASNWRYSGPSRLPVSLAAGSAGGIIHGSTGVGGPPIVAVLLAQDTATDTIRANVIAMMGSLILIGLPILWAYGLLTPRVLVFGSLAAPVYFGTIYLGTRYYAGAGKAFYRRISLATLALIALATLIAALLR